MPPKDYFFDGALSDADPEVARLSAVEAERQMRKLILIASESLCPAPVREALASEFVNLYAEGYPSTRMSLRERDRIGDHARGLSYFNRYADRRYYKGTEFCDIVESSRCPAQQRTTRSMRPSPCPAALSWAWPSPTAGT
jgi:glycine hydroxymethyltransferase